MLSCPHPCREYNDLIRWIGVKLRVKRWRIGLLGALVSLAALYFVASQVDVQAFQLALAQARFGFLIPTAFFLLLGLVTRAFRWRVLLSGGLPLRRAFSIMNVAYLVNGLLPLRIGELARIFLATRADIPVPPLKTTSTIIVERLLDLLAVICMMVLALAAGPIPDELRTAALVSTPMVVIGFIALVLLARNRGLAQRLLGMLTNRVPQWSADSGAPALRLSRWLDHFLDGLLPLSQTQTLLQALFWTVLSWGFSAVAGYILMFTFYPQASWPATLLYIAAAAFAIALPAVPGNLGPYELSVVLALSAMGYPERSTAAAFAVIVHGINLAIHASTGVIGFVQEGISLEQLSAGVQKMRQQQEIGTVTQDGLGSK